MSMSTPNKVFKLHLHRDSRERTKERKGGGDEECVGEMRRGIGNLLCVHST